MEFRLNGSGQNMSLAVRSATPYRLRMLEKMKLRSAIPAVLLALAMIGCDTGSPSTTADDIAADSALAADLALSNRDTLLIDSIGAYNPPPPLTDTAALPPATTATPATRMTGVTSGASSQPIAPAPTVAAPVEAIPAPAPAPPPPVEKPAPTPSAPRLTGTRACSSPTAENQNTCVRVLLADADMRLNRTYRALITEMRRQEGARGAAKDPPSVERLRVAQRAWLVYRDNECRRRGRGKEGQLWARPRVRCLAEFSRRRANELADNFSRLTAQ
jgi:uncharacterized protein YecT (DUF1311 family)